MSGGIFLNSQTVNNLPEANTLEEGDLALIWKVNGNPKKLHKASPSLLSAVNTNLKFIPLSFVPTAGETTLPSEIVDHINNTGFTKQAGEWIRFGLTFLQQGELYTATYDTKNLDVGVYNSGNPITFNNLNQIEYRRMSPELDVNVTIDLGDIGSSTIEAHINTTNSPDYDLEAGNLYTFDCIINGQAKSYLYRGAQPLLIGNGNNSVDADDFRDISDYDPNPSVSTKETFTALNGQTVFTLSSSPNNVDVFSGRTHLIEGSQYTLSNNEVTLSDGALQGTIITIRKY